MKITTAELIHIKLPMKNYYETSFGKLVDRQVVIVKLIEESGNIGYGEAPALNAPLYSSETVGTCWHILSEFILPMVLGKQISNPEEFNNLINPIKGNNFAKCGAETAFWHLYSLQKKRSIADLLGGRKKKIDIGEAVGIKESIDEVYTTIDQFIHEGFKRVKIKIKPGWDLEILQSIRKRYPKLKLFPDANSAYTLADVKLFQKMDKLNLMMIEQPLANDDIIDHATLQKKIKTGISLDESIESAQDARKAIEIGACKSICIKPGRVGGLLETKKIHDVALKNRIPVWMGGMLETSIGVNFCIAAASLPNFRFPAGISPSSVHYHEDVSEKVFRLEPKGTKTVYNSPGLEFNPSEKLLKKFQVKRKTIRPKRKNFNC